MSCIKTSISSFVEPTSLSRVLIKIQRWFLGAWVWGIRYCSYGEGTWDMSWHKAHQFLQLFWSLLEGSEDKDHFMGCCWGCTDPQRRRNQVWLNAPHCCLESMSNYLSRTPPSHLVLFLRIPAFPVWGWVRMDLGWGEGDAWMALLCPPWSCGQRKDLCMELGAAGETWPLFSHMIFVPEDPLFLQAWSPNCRDATWKKT